MKRKKGFVWKGNKVKPAKFLKVKRVGKVVKNRSVSKKNLKSWKPNLKDGFDFEDEFL